MGKVIYPHLFSSISTIPPHGHTASALVTLTVGSVHQADTLHLKRVMEAGFFSSADVGRAWLGLIMWSAEGLMKGVHSSGGLRPSAIGGGLEVTLRVSISIISLHPHPLSLFATLIIFCVTCAHHTHTDTHRHTHSDTCPLEDVCAADVAPTLSPRRGSWAPIKTNTDLFK